MPGAPQASPVMFDLVVGAAIGLILMKTKNFLFLLKQLKSPCTTTTPAKPSVRGSELKGACVLGLTLRVYRLSRAQTAESSVWQ